MGNLVNGKAYQFKVRAVNAAGPGMYAWQPARRRTAKPAEAPELTVTLADRQVDDTVTDGGGGALDGAGQPRGAAAGGVPLRGLA